MHQPTPSGIFVLKVRATPVAFRGARSSPVNGGTLATLQLMEQKFSLNEYSTG